METLREKITRLQGEVNAHELELVEQIKYVLPKTYLELADTKLTNTNMLLGEDGLLYVVAGELKEHFDKEKYHSDIFYRRAVGELLMDSHMHVDNNNSITYFVGDVYVINYQTRNCVDVYESTSPLFEVAYAGTIEGDMERAEARAIERIRDRMERKGEYLPIVIELDTYGLLKLVE